MKPLTVLNSCRPTCHHMIVDDDFMWYHPSKLKKLSSPLVDMWTNRENVGVNIYVMRWFYFIRFISMSSNYSSHIIIFSPSYLWSYWILSYPEA